MAKQTLTQQVEELEDDLHAAQEDLKDAQEELADAKAELDALQNASDDAVKDAERLQTACDALKAQLARVVDADVFPSIDKAEETARVFQMITELD